MTKDLLQIHKRLIKLENINMLLITQFFKELEIILATQYFVLFLICRDDQWQMLRIYGVGGILLKGVQSFYSE